MDDIEPLVRQLIAIKWLLVLIALLVALVVATFFVIAVNLVDVVRENRGGNNRQRKQIELEELLASGQNLAAKYAAIEWLTQQPQHADAHWALSKAHYQLGELSEAKQALGALLKVAPEEQYRVDAWLALIETEFAEKRPKPVV